MNPHQKNNSIPTFLNFSMVYQGRGAGGVIRTTIYVDFYSIT